MATFIKNTLYNVQVGRKRGRKMGRSLSLSLSLSRRSELTEERGIKE